MCTKTNICNKTIKTITNVFGDVEDIKCVLDLGHKGRCSYKWNHLLKNVKGINQRDIKKLMDKIFKAAYMTNGETAQNSPIVNRTTRFLAQNEKGEKLIPVPGNEKILLKEQGKYRVAVRKDELSTFEQCQKIEKDLVHEVLNVLHKGISQSCFFCGGKFTENDFIGRDRKSPTAAQHGHIQPLSDNEIRHISGNVSWQHRRCNHMQSDASLVETYKYMKMAVENLEKNFGF
jgi:hypothetical protein